MARPPSITAAEWEVMEAVWAEAPVTAVALTALLEPRRGWSATTVKTLLTRLVRKGALRFERDGKRFLYSPAFSRESCTRAETTSFLERVFGGRPTPLLAFLVQDRRLSAADLAELEALLRRHRKQRKQSGGRA